MSSPFSSNQRCRLSAVFVTIVAAMIFLVLERTFTRGVMKTLQDGFDIKSDIALSTPDDDDSYVSMNNTITSSSSIAIFYNVYIPPDNIDHGLSIVQEQLTMRRKSSILRDASLYYTHIGAVNTSLPPCDPCKQITTVEQGNEVLTLQAMYEYCVQHPNQNDTVVYIHNKGSYTRTPKNHRLRQLLTKGAFSNECVDGVAQSTCNVCAVHFGPLPFPQTGGNMFATSCRYVSKLIPPIDFTQRKEQVMDKVWNDTDWIAKHPYKQQWQFERPSWIGTERFAMEHWILSHPESQPCHVYPGHFGGYNAVPLDSLKWTPRLQSSHNLSSDVIKQQTQFHPWFRLPGRLYEYRQLYNTTPPPDSWVWSYYYNDTAQ